MLGSQRQEDASASVWIRSDISVEIWQLLYDCVLANVEYLGRSGCEDEDRAVVEEVDELCNSVSIFSVLSTYFTHRIHPNWNVVIQNIHAHVVAICSALCI